jgi:hypothetical protein
MRKSVQSLLARVHDMTQFVAEASPLDSSRGIVRSLPVSGDNYGRAADGNPAASTVVSRERNAANVDLANRLSGLSDALAAWNHASGSDDQIASSLL